MIETVKYQHMVELAIEKGFSKEPDRMNVYSKHSEQLGITEYLQIDNDGSVHTRFVDCKGFEYQNDNNCFTYSETCRITNVKERENV